MTTYTPDRWIVLEFVGKQQTIRKVFAGWYGGYLGGDSWQLNSGIVGVCCQDNLFKFSGYSGSTYYCSRNSYGMSVYMQRVLSSWIDIATVEINIISLEDIL